MPLREAPLRVARVDLRVVQDAELDGIDAELLGHLVHRHLERHQARRLARRPHVVALAEVERRELQVDLAVGGGIEELGRRDPASGNPPGRLPLTLTWPIAVSRAVRVAPSLIRWIVAARCVPLLMIRGR